MSPLPQPTALRGLRILSPRCSYQSPAIQTRALWNGTTQPYINHAIPHGSTIQQHQASQNTPSPLLRTSVGPEESSRIREAHTKYVQDLLSQHPFNASGAQTSKTRRTPPQQPHSLSAPIFRTDGPLTPYPISLDTGERLEPKHATLVRIVDRGGVERSIVVAEVDDQSGVQKSVLLALDLQDPCEEGTAVGRRILTAEEMYATMGMEAQDRKL
ncbi:hypothetical protein FKW77_005718 [Venturia effusa]|uniref:Uncharacterized protein n=1 Tax=Venturia effusa TaxID=50376 RepID=A0A517LIT5_9PEZI|nr:hypothetical protein FKW77_005718 [Venturia effusa]